MARGKKKEQLSLEEKLEQALVPAGEQPYQVPGNWCWVTMENLADLHRGVSYKKNQAHSNKCGNDCLVLRGGNILEGAIDIEAENIYVDKSLIKSEQYIQENDIIIVSSTGSKKVIGRAGISFANYSDVSFGAFLMLARPKEQSCKRYVNYYFQSQIYRERIRFLASGVNINNIRAEYIMKSLVPLPPMQEQQRIVDRIERMFAQLDEAKEKVQYVRNCCDDNFASAVHEALTGNLTERWRLQKGISKSEWKKDKLGNLGILERGRSKHRPRNDSRLFGGAYPFIQTGDVAEANVFIKKHKQTLSEFGLEQSKMFAKGTLCITIAANIGDTAILSYDCCFPDSVVGFTPYKNVESKFVYYMMSELQKEIEANAPATAQKNINLRILKDIDMIIPPISEQKKIIAILDELFDKKIKIKTKTEETVDAINRIKKLILVKAFRGQLGTNHPEEESAMELLKSILMES